MSETCPKCGSRQVFHDATMTAYECGRMVNQLDVVPEHDGVACLRSQLAAALAAKDAAEGRVALLEEALKEIVDPMAAMKRRVEESNGEYVLDCRYAAKLCSNPGHLQGIARAALSPPPAQE